ncbi:peroxiredoxin type-2 [Ranunculus cassubicifolius]
MGELMSQYIQYTKSLFAHGILDEQFQQLQQLQDESTPDFVREVATLFFDDSKKIVNELTVALKQQIIDFKLVDANVHQLKGSSSSIGAQRVKNVCIHFRNSCEQRNYDGCRKCLQDLQRECSEVEQRLQTLFMMEQQIMASGASIPVVEIPDQMMV